MSFDMQLKDRLESAASRMPGEPLDLVTTLNAARRSRRTYLVAAAVAAVVVVVGGVTAAVTLGDPPAPKKVIAPEPRLSDADRERAFATVGEFLDSINISGERAQAEAMWAFFSSNSKAHFDNDANNFDPVSFNGETLGAYALAEEREMDLTIVSSSDGETVGVVTINGVVTREVATEWDAFAVPVRIVDGRTTVELFSDAPYPAAATPDIAAYPPETLPRGGSFAVNLSKRGAASVTVSVHEVGSDFVVQGNAQLEYGDRRWVWRSDALLDAGRYVVTFVVTSESGGLAATAEPFFVE